MCMTNYKKMRFDLQVAASWVTPGATVLDLGCGKGDLLAYLKQEKNVKGTGIELDEQKAAICIQRGLSVMQGDISDEILDYPDNSFDYVIVSQTLQQVYDPPSLIRSILRVGKKSILSFPNFSHWRVRLQLLLTGHAPKTSQLPYEWYNTPNIRVITIADFRKFSKDMGFSILEEAAIQALGHDNKGRVIEILPNIRADYGLFLICNGKHR